jgi:hypothetical protein
LIVEEVVQCTDHAKVEAPFLSASRCFHIKIASIHNFKRNRSCVDMDEMNNAQPPSVSKKCSEDLPDIPSLKPEPRPSHIHEDPESISRNNSEKGAAKAVGGKRKRDAGRKEWRYGHDPPIGFASLTDTELSRNLQDKRARNNAQSRAGESNLVFSKEEIANEERKPKRKVAVMIGYSGSGYRGMQLYVLTTNT